MKLRVLDSHSILTALEPELGPLEAESPTPQRQLLSRIVQLSKMELTRERLAEKLSEAMRQEGYVMKIGPLIEQIARPIISH